MIKESKKRSLRFAQSNCSHAIPGLDSIENKESLWFSEDELKETSRECMRTVVSMLQGVALSDDNDQFTTRGLEYMTPDGFDIAASSRNVIHVVLDEQQRQKKESGTVDSVVLAGSMESVSRHRMRIAQLTGQQDERMAHMLNNTSNMPRNSWSDSTKAMSTEEVMKQIAERRRGRIRPSVSTSSSDKGLCDDATTRRQRASRGSIAARRRSCVYPSRDGSRRVSDSAVEAIEKSRKILNGTIPTRLSLQN
eukprot:scaffold13271_cov110-Cylindrotheca_fusiformis.AAC.10